jgi:Arc/MetJ-type ribon-helix-helix transcriptional regulator
MTIQIALRLPEEAVRFVDEQVAAGAAKSRADFVWHAIRREQRRREAERDLEILLAQPYDEFEDMHEHLRRRGHPSID